MKFLLLLPFIKFHTHLSILIEKRECLLSVWCVRKGKNWCPLLTRFKRVSEYSASYALEGEGEREGEGGKLLGGILH